MNKQQNTKPQVENQKTVFEQLEEAIQGAYSDGVTLDQAEKLAAKALHGQIVVSKDLSSIDLEARMAKSGVKAVKAAVYMDEATKAEKKPTEAMLTALVDSNEIVSGEQNRLDTVEVKRDELNRQYDIFREAHIYFRGVSKGRFE